MRLEGIEPGDIVAVDLHGRRFYAIVSGPVPDGLAIQPIERGVNRFTCRSRQVVGHWAKRGRPRPVAGRLEQSPHQLELDTSG
ncbi:MAG: hypothetical protein ACR2KV_14880 [Solirubrobacteraceae bacterium]